LALTKADVAHRRGWTGSGVTVAVVDTGVDTDHPDLDANIVAGYDFIWSSSDPTPVGQGNYRSHGTHVAGIIAAENNGIGITGVAYDAKIMPLRIGASSGTVYTSYADNAFDFARTNGAFVINNSWGSSKIVDNVIANGEQAWFKSPNRAEDTSVSANFKTAAEAAVNAGMVVVFSVGNNYWNSATGSVPVYRDSDDTLIQKYATNQFSAWGLATNETQIYAEYFNENSNVAGQWLAVVATDASNVIADFSNGCGDAKTYCLAAPGVGINSTYDTDDIEDADGDGYRALSGTSMAAPHVAGAIAVLKQRWPNLTAAEIISLLLDNATDIGASGTDNVYGRGLLNLDASTASSGTLQTASLNSDGSFQGTPINAEELRMSLSSAFRADIGKGFVLGALDNYQRQYFISPGVSSSPAKTDYRRGNYRFLKENLGDGMSFYFTEFSGDDPTLKLESPGSLTSHLMANGHFWRQKLETRWLDLSINYSANQDCQLVGVAAQRGISGDYGNLIAGIGYEREPNSFLCSKFDGLDSEYIQTDTASLFFNYEKDLLPRTKLVANYSYHKSNVEFGGNALNFGISGLSSDAADIALEHRVGRTILKLGYYWPLSILSGIAYYDTVWGYGKNASYLMEHKQIELKPRSRQVNVVANMTYGSREEHLGLTMYFVKNTNHVAGENDSGVRIDYTLRW